MATNLVNMKMRPLNCAALPQWICGVSAETHLEEKWSIRRADLLAEGQHVRPQLLQVHLLNVWMQMILLFNEVH